MNAVMSEVQHLLSKLTQLPVEQLPPEVDLFDSGALDSMRALQLLNDLERRFGVAIPQERVSDFTTPRAIADLVGQLQAAR